MISSYIIYFFIYCFIGYLSEVAYCSIAQRKLVNRGFLSGPYLPIYGFGAVFVILILTPLKPHPVLLFILSVIITSAIEYFGSWMLEKYFNTKLWDYSRYRININGRVCLLNSTLFGIMCMVAMYLVQPFFEKYVMKIPLDFREVIAGIIIAVMSFDFMHAVFQMKAFRFAIDGIREKREELEERLEVVSADYRTRMEKQLDSMYRLAVKHGYRFYRAFPHMTSRNEELRLQYKLLFMEMRSLKEKFEKERRERKIALHDAKAERKCRKH